MIIPEYYWAKTTQDGQPGKSVVSHLNDVRAVAKLLLSSRSKLLEKTNCTTEQISSYAGLHDIGKVPDTEPELPHAIFGSQLAEQFKERPEIVNAIGSHHDEMEMSNLYAPLVQVCDAISGARPGARREVVEAYIKRLNDLENIALTYPGVTKTFAIQAGRELRVIVGAEKVTDDQATQISFDLSKKIQNEMTYPGQIKITVIRETRSVNYAR